MPLGTHLRHNVPLIALAAALAFGTGAMDVASFTQLGGVFSSVMTGNLVLLGLAAARPSGELAAHTALAIRRLRHRRRPRHLDCRAATPTRADLARRCHPDTGG